MTDSLHRMLVLDSIDFIERNLSSSIDVGKVCEQVRMSPWQFQRVFRFQVGTSIGAYIRGRRLTECFRKLLEAPNYRILDLALDFQFGSHEAFSRSFKAHFGFSPSEVNANAERLSLLGTPKFARSDFERIWASIQERPEVKDYASSDLIGFEREVSSPFAENTDLESETHLVWKEFSQKIKGVSKSPGFSAISYGVALSTNDHLVSPKMRYFAAKRESDFLELPDGFLKLRLAGGQYASFSLQGSLKQIQLLVDYIYAIWLPGSKFTRRAGSDFEVFESSVHLPPGIISYQYNIPVIAS